MYTRFELLSAKKTSRQRLNSWPDLIYYVLKYRLIADPDVERINETHIWAKDEADAARLFYRDFR
jgi:hypothetical protein